MVVRNLNVDWTGRTGRPLEANPTLVVDADAVLACAIALESFQTVSTDCSEVSEAGRRIEAVEPDLGLSGETGKLFDVFASGEARGLTVPVAHNHQQT
jgi:hypothetical protein